MLYLLAPWTAVNLTDYFFVRRGHYAIADLFTPNGIYGAWSWRGLTAFIAGVLAEIPFVDLPFFVGPAAKAMGEVDIAFIVGLLVSGVVYVAVTRSLDVSGELAFIESHPEIADPASAEDIAETVAEEENEATARGSDVPVGPVDATRRPRYTEPATFARLPRIDQVPSADVSIVGVPFDSGVSYRPGARFGPGHVRAASKLLRPYNPAWVSSRSPPSRSPTAATSRSIRSTSTTRSPRSTRRSPICAGTGRPC